MSGVTSTIGNHNGTAPPTGNRWQLPVRCFAAGVAMMGAAVLAGWMFDVPALKSVLPGAVEMKVNTAIALVLAAGALLLLLAPAQPRLHRAAQWIAAAVVLLGVLTIAEYVFGWDAGIDQALLRDRAQAFSASPGRMSPYSAVVFVGLGIGLVALPRRGYRWLVSAMALGTATIGVVQLLGYLWNARELTTDEWLPPVAVHTAAAFLLLGVGLLIANHHMRFRPATPNLQFRGRVATKVLVGFIVAVVLFCFGGGITYRMASRFTDTQRLVAHTQEVRIAIQQLYMSIADAESHQRSYLLTGNADYRRDYQFSAAMVDSVAGQLRQLLADNPDQLTRLQAALSATALRLDTLARHVELHDQLGLDAVRALIATDNGSGTMRSIRTALLQMDEVEQRLMKQRNEQLVRDRGFTLISMVATLIIGSVTLFVLFESIIHDIRARVRTNAALAAAQQDAQRANQAKSEFLAAMSHEIRTPINGIVGTLEVLHQSSLQAPQLEMVDLVRDSADSLLRIINDILDFSKIEAGRLEIERAPMSVGEVVEKTGNLLNRYAERKGCVLTVYVDPAIPRTVIGDSARVRQVLINLVGNAIKFSSDLERPGRVALRAALKVGHRGHASIEFRVIDNGVGIEAATLPRLFNAFTQADASTTRRYGGSGLGLAICKQLVDLMGGEIQVQSTPRLGSTFTVQLPFEVGEPTGETGADASVIEGLRCVVVGGGAGLADDLAAYLAAEAASVSRVANLVAAREQARDAPAGLAVWIVDAGDDEPATEELQAAIRARSDLALKVVLVLVGRGRRRMPRAQAEGIVTLDGNALNRQVLAQAVGMAAGRIVAPVRPPEEPKIRRGEPPVRGDAIRRRNLILVAEDSEINQKVIRQQLNLLGYSADIAANGREALQRLHSGDYALLLTDLHMPEVDGYDLTLQVRVTNGDRARLPIIALTANALQGEAERCLAAGMNDYLTKPVPLAVLDATLRKWLPDDAVAGAAQAPRAAPVDTAVLGSLVGDDPLVVNEFLREFMVQAERLSGELVAAWRSQRPKDAAAIAHKLKSSARSVGALGLGDLCAAIEVDGVSGHPGEVTALLVEFEREAAAVVGHIRQLLAAGNGTTVRVRQA